MESVGEKNSIDQLEDRLGVRWLMIKKARENATEKRGQLRKALDSLDSDDTSIIVFGSLARDEFTSGSDIDWTLLVDGMADPQHFDDALKIKKHITDVQERPPGREGTFEGLTVSHDLIHRIGGEDDTNRNTTQRILLLLESAPIGRSEAYARVVNNILRRYVTEDYGLVHSKGPYNVPRFLQNDVARFWRTMAVDFAYKQRQRADEGWALRASKLRISRKLTYASGLLMCFASELDRPKALESAGAELALHQYVDNLRLYTEKTPLEIVARTLLRFPQLSELAITLFDTYDESLCKLDDNGTRSHLEHLSRNQADSDEVYNTMRQLGHKFQNSLTQLFLEENGTGLYKLTKVYGVF